MPFRITKVHRQTTKQTDIPEVKLPVKYQKLSTCASSPTRKLWPSLTQIQEEAFK